jgi:tRNA U38,U39,U40 pseudouridine synthase TruA
MAFLDLLPRKSSILNRKLSRGRLECGGNSTIQNLTLMQHARRANDIIAQVDLHLAFVINQKLQERRDVSRVQLAGMNRHRSREVQRRHYDYAVSNNGLAGFARGAVASG